jgi:hypothetical protein
VEVHTATSPFSVGKADAHESDAPDVDVLAAVIAASDLELSPLGAEIVRLVHKIECMDGGEPDMMRLARTVSAFREYHKHFNR